MTEDKRKQMFLGTFAIIGGGLLMLLQRMLFATGAGRLIQTTSLSRQVYAERCFTPAALIVFLVSATCAVVWYRRTLKWNVHYAPKDKGAARGTWGSILLFPLLSIAVALFVWGNASPKAFPWLAGFLVIDMLVIYWLSTALSTPDLMVPAVPCATMVRK
jgi:hypothetical protein